MTFFLVAFVAGCTTPHQVENRVTKQNYHQVSLPIESDPSITEPVRTWLGYGEQYLYNPESDSTSVRVSGDQLNTLVLSGGGSKGAFGVGFVTALYDQGKLPDYSIVTGVSAGALMAPFVFVGGEEIPKLKSTIMGMNDKMLLGHKNFFNVVFKDGISKGESFMSYVASVYDDEFIEKIAQQHRDGRRLLIGTTHFDSGEMVVWNLGQIAASDYDQKSHLIHQVLVASASIPAVFPPQFIEVEYQEESLEEMHVDGGLSAQMFLQAANIDFQNISDALGLSKQPQVHIIRNGMLKMPYEIVEDKGMDLLSRTLKSMTTLQSRGDLYRMMYLSELQELDVSFTYIDENTTVTQESNKIFDVQYMQELYLYGYAKGQETTPWTTEIPN